MYDVYSKFDIKQHKETFVNYCEVAIDTEGKVHYAVPSHQGFLEIVGASRRNISVSQFVQLCPKSMYANYMTWLIQETGYVLCWTDFWMGDPNPKQKASLTNLIVNGLVANKKVRS